VLRSILVVDDDAAFRELAARLLTGWGYQVVGEVGGVDDALACAVELRPDLVVSDISLPDGDGFELTRRLVALRLPVQVVLISSDPDTANQVAAVRCGARGFVPKGEFSDAALRELLERW
jgi:CheY-like chemotaxis protein